MAGWLNGKVKFRDCVPKVRTADLGIAPPLPRENPVMYIWIHKTTLDMFCGYLFWYMTPSSRLHKESSACAPAMCALRRRRNGRANCVKEWLTSCKSNPASSAALRRARQPSAYTMVSRSSSRLSNKPVLATSSLLSVGGLDPGVIATTRKAAEPRGSALFAPPHQFARAHRRTSQRIRLRDVVATWQWQLAKLAFLQM